MEETKCKYCSKNSDDFLTEDTISLGILGEYDISTLLVGRDKKYFMQVSITDDHGDIFFKNHPVYYCPMCGRKL